VRKVGAAIAVARADALKTKFDIRVRDTALLVLVLLLGRGHGGSSGELHGKEHVRGLNETSLALALVDGCWLRVLTKRGENPHVIVRWYDCMSGCAVTCVRATNRAADLRLR